MAAIGRMQRLQDAADFKGKAMKAWTVILAAGIAVAAGGFWIARDLSTGGSSQPPVSEWRPARQVTFHSLDGGTQTMHFQPDQDEDRAAVTRRLADFESRWSDALSIVKRTSRISLAAPAKDLQGLAREGRNIRLTECLEPARPFWSAYLDAQVGVVLAFMAEDPALPSFERLVYLQYANWTKAVDACG